MQRRFIEQIKRSVPPSQFYRHELTDTPNWGDRRGWVDGGLCPFHDDRRAGSFRVNLDTGAFTCFSCGAKGGDILAFLMRRKGMRFVEAVQALTQAWRVAL